MEVAVILLLISFMANLVLFARWREEAQARKTLQELVLELREQLEEGCPWCGCADEKDPADWWKDIEK